MLHLAIAVHQHTEIVNLYSTGTKFYILWQSAEAQTQHLSIKQNA